MNSKNSMSTFEMEDSNGKILAFLISEVTRKSVVEAIGERSERGDGAIVYMLDDFSIQRDAIRSSNENITDDELVDFIYDFFVKFIQETQGENNMVFSIKVGKIPLSIYQKAFERLDKGNYVDDIKVNTLSGSILLICE